VAVAVVHRVRVVVGAASFPAGAASWSGALGTAGGWAGDPSRVIAGRPVVVDRVDRGTGPSAPSGFAPASVHLAPAPAPADETAPWADHSPWPAWPPGSAPGSTAAGRSARAQLPSAGTWSPGRGSSRQRASRRWVGGTVAAAVAVDFAERKGPGRPRMRSWPTSWRSCRWEVERADDGPRETVCASEYAKMKGRRKGSALVRAGFELLES